MSTEPRQAGGGDGKSGVSGAGKVDAYTEFLHLPPGPRPPHLYQLLELELFCPHVERIEHAVRKQFRKIKPFEEHPDREVRERIQDVMTHIATARVVLSDPVKRQHYDVLLAEHLKLDRDEIIRSRTAARTPEFRLTVVAGPSAVNTHLDLLPDRTITIGADVSTDLTLPGWRMRPEHAQLEPAGDGWHICPARAQDLVLVNDARCGSRPLDEADMIELGGYRLRFDSIVAPRPEPAGLAPPLTLMIREGPSIPEAVFSAVAPASILIGRDSTALWQLVGPDVALHHARIESDAALWEVHDLQSDTGTFQDGFKVTRAILKNRDLITIGAFHIQVSFRD